MDLRRLHGELELAHDEQSDLFPEGFVLENRPSSVFDGTASLLDGDDEPDGDIGNTTGIGQSVVLLIGHFDLLTLVAETVPTLCRRIAYHVLIRGNLQTSFGLFTVK